MSPETLYTYTQHTQTDDLSVTYRHALFTQRNQTHPHRILGIKEVDRMIKLPAPNQSAERGISRHIIKSTATQLYKLNKLLVSTKEKRTIEKALHFYAPCLIHSLSDFPVIG